MLQSEMCGQAKEFSFLHRLIADHKLYTTYHI